MKSLNVTLEDIDLKNKILLLFYQSRGDVLAIYVAIGNIYLINLRCGVLV